jgi:Arc/MetJ family transcription regulator
MGLAAPEPLACLPCRHHEVYRGVMARTNIDIDDEVLARVQAAYGLRTKREAVDFALRRLLVVPFTREEALAAEGNGWAGDLDAMRAGTAPRT